MFARNTTSFSFPESELQTIKKKMLNWLRPFSIFSYLDNNRYQQHTPRRFEMLAGAGALSFFDHIDEGSGDWIFGHMAYDHKNQIEPKLTSQYPERIGFEDKFFFKPEIVVFIPADKNELHIGAANKDASVVLNEILNASAEIKEEISLNQEISWQYKFTQEEYIRSVDQIRQHIIEGDCYEMNFCAEAFVEDLSIDAVHIFHKLNVLNPSPFAALYRNHDAWLMCASPERFLYRNGEHVISQPIKGTSRRDNDNAAQDEQLKQLLYTNNKERAENVMIVDLVRNDLARSCLTGSITVPELFGVYTFPQVHQLISTVSGVLKPGISNKEIMYNTFPMGSMTGAPKYIVMQLTEQYERSRRGLYSGTVGYVTPEGDFDFNVVIRSLLYNASDHYLSYQTGGAITYDSNARAEWEEMRLKARAMEQIFVTFADLE